MPEFSPNEYMFKKFEKKGNQRWQVYAWCVRDAKAKAGNFQVTDIPFRANLAYKKYLNGKNQIDGFENKTIDEIIEGYN